MRFLIFILACFALSLEIYASSGWGGYIEGGINALGNETYTESGTFLEKEVEGTKYWGEAGLHYHKKSKQKEVHFDSKLKVTDLMYLEYSVKEANIVHHRKDWSFSYGRVFVNWSDLDRSWRLGKVNNRVNFDFIDSEQEGLIGFLARSKKRRGFNWSLFASALYIPELNPGSDINEQDQTISPKSAWSSRVSDTVTLQGQQRAIRYDVDTPSITDIIFQYSIGGKIGFRAKNFQINGFILRKPENNISVAAGINYDTSQNIIIANVEPRVFYHNILGGNLAYKFKNNIMIKLSTILASPEQRPEDPFDFVTTQTNLKSGKRREHYWGASLSKAGKNYRLAAQFIARVSDFDRTNDVLAENPRWSQAINLFTQLRLFSKWRATVDFKFDTLSKDRILGAELAYQIHPHLLLKAGVQMIGIDENEISFWTSFANNDSVYMGGRFIF